MLLGSPEIIGAPVEDDAVGNKIESIVASANTLVTRFQQVFMLVDHAKAEHAVYSNDELG